MTGRWIAVWSRGLRSEPGRSLGVALLILVTVLMVDSVPRLLVRASDDALHAEVLAAAATVRNLELVQDGRIDASEPDPLRLVDTAGIALDSRLPAPLPAVVASTGVAIDTPLWHPLSGTPLDSVLNMRIQEDVDAHIRIVTGRRPTGTTSMIPDPTPEADKDVRLLLVEAMMPAETASRLDLQIGGRLILQPEPSDPLGADRGVRMAVDLVGTYEVIDPADPFWIDDSSVAHSYTYALAHFVEYVGGTMLIAPEAYPALMTATQPSGLPMIYHWRSYVGTDSLQSGELDALAAALRRAATIYPPATATLNNGGLFAGPDQMSPASLRTGLLGLISAHQARWLSGATILTILWTGAGLVILASLALVAETIARRRRVSLGIVGRRGASAGQVASAILSESAILVVPAALAGTIASVLLIPVADQGPTLIVAIAGTAGAVGFIALASRRNRTIDLVERPRRRQRLGSGRLVAETLIVGLAVVGAVLLRGRATGAAPAGPSGVTGPAGSAAGGPDPFLALAPALVGLAAGIIAIRVLPLIVGLAARLFASGRGLVGVLGFRRAARDGSVSAVLVVALTATTVGAFASVLLDQLDAGARSASWLTVGANFQVTGPPASLAAFEAAPPSGVEATAAISSLSATVSTGGGRDLVVVDPAAVALVGRGTPADSEFPAAMLLPVTSGPLPAIVSSDAGGSGVIGQGQDFSVRIGGVAVQLQAVAVRADFPSVPAGQPFVVVASNQLGSVPEVTAILVRSSTLTTDQLRADVKAQSGLTVQGQSATESALRDAPAVVAVTLGVVSAAVAVLLYGLLTIILAIALDTASRRRETARLQILGLSNRQTISLVMVEFVPAVVIGVLAGVALGFSLISFVGPGLGLAAVLGVGALEPATADLGRLLGIAALTLALILAATLLSTVLERQTQLATAVRD